MIDALAARNTGWAAPSDLRYRNLAGFGVNTHGAQPRHIGVTVIGLGVPTVVDARTVRWVTGRGRRGMSYPRGSDDGNAEEIDLIIQRAQLVAMAVNRAAARYSHFR